MSRSPSGNSLVFRFLDGGLEEGTAAQFLMFDGVTR